MYYIEELDKQRKIDSIFTGIKVKENVIYIPKLDKYKNQELEKRYIDKKKKILKIVIRLSELLEKKDCNKIAVSQNLSKNELFMNYLSTYDIEVYSGKMLLEIIVLKTIDYIVEKRCLNKDTIQITIAVNDISDIMFENVKLIIEKYKKVNITTKNIIRFKKMEELVLKKLGKMILISDNKKKSLLKSDIILNVDFDEELINKYIIKDDAIIINVNKNVKINKKRFNGLNINDYEINCNRNIFNSLIVAEKYMIRDIYESVLSPKLLYQEINDKIGKDNVQIAYLKSNNITI